MPHTVPPEVARKIARLLNDRRLLSVLARTSRTFQAVAERYLYIEVHIVPLKEKLALLHTIGQVPRVAQLVRFFRFTNHPTRVRNLEVMQHMHRTAAQPEFWELLRRAIHNLGQLEYFELDDDPFVVGQARRVQSSVLVPPPPHLQASEIRLSFPWDANISAFLATQTMLRKLHMPDIIEDEPLEILPSGAMPSLTLFEGPLFIIDQLYHCPMTRLKFTVESEEAVSLLPLVLPELYRFKNLYSLSIVLLPPEAAERAVDVISNACPNLCYLSVIPFSCHHDVVRFLNCSSNISL